MRTILYLLNNIMFSEDKQVEKSIKSQKSVRNLREMGEVRSFNIF